MRYSIITSILLISLGGFAQSFRFESMAFCIKEDTFSVNSEILNGAPTITLKQFSESINRNYKVRRQCRVCTGHFAFFSNGIKLSLGSYHWRKKRNPQVLGAYFDFTEYREDLVFFGQPLNSNLSFDKINRIFEEYIVESSNDQSPPGKGWINIQREGYFLSISFDREEKMDDVFVRWPIF